MWSGVCDEVDKIGAVRCMYGWAGDLGKRGESKRRGGMPTKADLNDKLVLKRISVAITCPAIDDRGP